MIKVAIITTDNREQWRQHHLLTPFFGTAPEALIQGFSHYPEDVEVHVISCTRQKMSSPSMLGQNIHFHSLLIPKWGMMKSLYVGASLVIRKKLQELKPHIVHGQGSEREAALAAVLSNFTNVLTLHGNMRLLADFQGAPIFSPLWFIGRIESFALKRTRGVICITQYTQNLVSPFNSNTWVLPNAVDERYFRVKKDASNKRKILLCVGLICPRKNQNFLIEALDALRDLHDFELRLLGDAPADSHYAQKFHTLLKDRPWCSYAGFVDRDELAGELGRASALILPSLEDNCPMVVLESMAASLPILAANVGGVPDLITSGRTGTLFDPESIQSIRSAVTTFLNNPNDAATMADTANQEALNRFHPAIIAKSHMGIYKSLIEANNRIQP